MRLACIIAMTALCTAAAPQSAPSAPAPIKATAGDRHTAPAAEVRERFPLLREGSYLNRAPVTLHFDPTSGTWSLTLRDDLETEADREVTALPCEALDDMITHIRGRTQVQWFELTAMVLSYHNRNYLLPLVAIPLSAEPPRQPRAAMMPPGTIERVAAATPPGARASTPPGARSSTPPPPDAGASLPSPPPASIDPERFAADVERALEERIRVVPRSSDAGPAPSPFVPQRSVRGLSEGAAPVTLQTSVRVQDRRGVVTRDPVSGTWRFVIHGERTDMGERGVELLPSSVLERMERFVRQSATPPVLLVSGQLTRFDGRNYLLPSSFRNIASGRWIYP